MLGAVAPHLFDPIQFRSITLPNRIVVSPMCQYSSDDGFATDWHLVHLGTRAVGGAALIFTEATAVSAEGRISPNDLGLWKDQHIDGLARVTHFVHSQRSLAGIQLAHAGRKASTARPWEGHGRVLPSEGGWDPVSPTTVPFTPGDPHPRCLTTSDIASVVREFAESARRAVAAGFDVAEIHAAHGYLLHEFLSPLSNDRTDEYGGGFDNRIRICVEVVDAVRSVWPDRLPLFVRISATDWVDGGWDLDQSVELARRLAAHGVDLIDCSSGGNVAGTTIYARANYQLPFATEIRRKASIPTGAVGLITSPRQADDIISSESADCVFLARQMLRDPYWPLHAAGALGHHLVWPAQYRRAQPEN